MAGLSPDSNFSQADPESATPVSEQVQALQLARAQAQEAADASRAKSEFLASMSAELRTPVEGVLGLSHLLMQTGLTQQQREFAEAIRDSGESLLAILNDLVDFSRIEIGQLFIDSTEFELSALLEDIAEEVRPRVAEKKLGYFVDVDASVPSSLTGSRTRIKQVLLNLVVNAIKFTQRGSVTVHAKALTQDDAGIRLRLEVQDTGTGIRWEDLAGLFQPFGQVASYQLQSSTGSSGLGLAICKRLVAMMGGQIGVDSEPNHGSTFWLELPLAVTKPPEAVLIGKPPLLPQVRTALVPSSTATAEMPPAAELGRAVGGLDVLLVEDNAINLALAKALLQRMGHRVSTAVHGQDALTTLAAQRFDLVIMDCQMPVMDGYEATRAIRAGEGGVLQPGICILAMTANTQPGDRERCLQAGMNGYVPKPINLELLRQAVGEHMGPPVI